VPLPSNLPGFLIQWVLKRRLEGFGVPQAKREQDIRSSPSHQLEQLVQSHHFPSVFLVSRVGRHLEWIVAAQMQAGLKSCSW
jgi:hypothetical protein